MNRKKNFIASIVIILLGVIILSGILMHSNKVTKEISDDFVANKKGAAEKIYARLTSIDLDNEYPVTPESVMDIYNDTVIMLYGNMIANEGLYEEILSIQRKLYSNALLQSNSFEGQYNNLIESIAKLDDLKAYTTSISHESAFYDKNENMCVVKIKQHLSKLGATNWSYHLVHEDGEWKINSWELTQDKPRD